MDSNLGHYASKISGYLGVDVTNRVGAGAAGGTDAGLMAFTGAQLVPGIDLLMDFTSIEKKIAAADYVFTGEGRIDRQTLHGKTVSGILRITNKYSKPLIAFAGKIQDPEKLYAAGLTSAIGILPSVMSLEEALLKGPDYLEKAVIAVVRLIALNNDSKK